MALAPSPTCPAQPRLSNLTHLRIQRAGTLPIIPASPPSTARFPPAGDQVASVPVAQWGHLAADQAAGPRQKAAHSAAAAGAHGAARVPGRRARGRPGGAATTAHRQAGAAGRLAAGAPACLGPRGRPAQPLPRLLAAILPPSLALLPS